ncbi:hypothetical protein ACWD7C_41040 [Streptomyces sp. NPDC005134]|uniref:hypothetical protein n=1 Tax=unclassified Streptomyces TaxID=2593676 RepID=UPI0033AA6ED9
MIETDSSQVTGANDLEVGDSCRSDTSESARPIGALVFGHYGDRLGRKRGLVA